MYVNVLNSIHILLTHNKDSTVMDKIKVGQLLSLEWKLGVALKSKNCTKINSPFVTIQMVTLDSMNKKSSWCFELTIPEFKV